MTGEGRATGGFRMKKERSTLRMTGGYYPMNILAMILRVARPRIVKIMEITEEVKCSFPSVSFCWSPSLVKIL